MAQPTDSLAESMQAMQLDPSAQAPQAPSNTASSSTRAQAPRPAPSPVAPQVAPQPQTGLEEPTPLKEEEGLVIIDEPEPIYGPPTRQEWEMQEPELDQSLIFPHILEDSNFNFIKCENCEGVWFRIHKEGMNKLCDLKCAREQKPYRFEHECLHCGGKERSYHRVGGRREYYGWHIVGGKTVMTYAGPRPDIDPAWVRTMGTHTLRWYPVPYKFCFQVECLMTQTYREPSEQAEYIQEMKWQKTLWE